MISQGSSTSVTEVSLKMTLPPSLKSLISVIMEKSQRQNSSGNSLTFPPNNIMKMLPTHATMLHDIQRILKRMNPQEISRLYQSVDRNGSGKVTFEELDQFCRKIDPRLDFNDTLAIFRLLNTANSNSLNYIDFLKSFPGDTIHSSDSNGNREYLADISFDPTRYQEMNGRNPLTPRSYYGSDSNGHGSSGDIMNGNYSNIGYYHGGNGSFENQPSRELLFSLSWAREIFEDLVYVVVSIENTTIDSYFHSYDGIMNINEVKRRLDALGIPVSHDTDKWLGQISDRNGNVNIQLFKRCAEHFKSLSRRSPDDFERARLDMIRAEINNCLNREGLDFDRAFRFLFNNPTQTCSRYGLECQFSSLGIRNNSNVKLLFKIFGDYSRYIRLNDFSNFLRDANSINQHYIDIEVVLNQLRRTMETLEIDAETIFDRFDAKKDGIITLDEFARGIKYIDDTLNQSQVKNLFNMLDKDGYISKFRFMKLLSKIPVNKIPDLLAWANPLFEQINKCVELSKKDLHEMMRVDRGLATKQSFRRALYLLGFDIRKYEQELQQIIEVVLEDRPDTINFKAFDLCLKKSKEEIKKPFTQDELAVIRARFAEMNRRMTTDTLSFDTVFVNRDRANRGFITTKDFEDIIKSELCLQMDEGFELVMRL